MIESYWDGISAMFRPDEYLSRIDLNETFINMERMQNSGGNFSVVSSLLPRRGFTLIEILFVVGLLAILATLVVTNLDSVTAGPRERVAKMWVTGTVQTALTAYRMDVGEYPTTEQGLAALLRPPARTEARWRGPYLEELPMDPWNNPYQYRFPGTRNPTRFDVWSTGPDPRNASGFIGNWRDNS